MRRFLEEANGEKEVKAQHLCGSSYKERGRGRQGLKGRGVSEERPGVEANGSELCGHDVSEQVADDGGTHRIEIVCLQDMS